MNIKSILILGMCLTWNVHAETMGNHTSIQDQTTKQIIHSINSTTEDLTLGNLELNSKINLKNILACQSVNLAQATFNYVCLSKVFLPKFLSDSLYVDSIQHKNTAIILYSASTIKDLKAQWIYLKLDKNHFKNVVSQLTKKFGKEDLSYPLKISDIMLHYKYSKTYLWRTKNKTTSESKELQLHEINNPYNRLPDFKSSAFILKNTSQQNPFLTLPIEYFAFSIQQSHIPTALLTH